MRLTSKKKSITLNPPRQLPDPMSIFASLKDKLTQYIDVYVKLFKLNFMGSTAKLLSYVMFALICMFLVFITMLLMGLGIIEGFVELGLSRVGASFATMGVYILILGIVFALRNNITGFFAGTFLKILTEDNEEDDDKKRKS